MSDESSVPRHQVPDTCQKPGEVWIANGYAVKTTHTTDKRVFFKVITEL